MSEIHIPTFNFWVLVIVLAGWPLVLLPLELFILWLRGQKIHVATISMVMRDQGWRLTSFVYLWAMCLTHWWWTGPKWAPVWTAVLTWVILALLLVWDVIVWKRPKEWRPWYRSPKLWLVVGLLAGAILFPQRET